MSNTVQTRKCLVDGCPSTTETGSMCRWPRGKDLAQLWVELLSSHSSKLRKTLENRGRVGSNFYVCKLHFEGKFIKNEKRFPSSWPTLFTDVEISTRKPTYPIIVSVPTAGEHSYAVNTDLGNRKRNWTESDVDVALDVKNLCHDHSYGTNVNKTMKLNFTSQCDELDQYGELEDIADHEMPRHSRQRIVRSVNQLTPKCRRIYNECAKILKSKQRLTSSFKERIQKSEQLAKNQTFQAVVNNMSPNAQRLFSKLVYKANKHLKPRRFTTAEKQKALTLMQRSPKCYKLLQEMLILPTRRTLHIFCRNVPVKPGVDSNVMASLKERVKTWDEKKKYCSILFDEVKLSPHLTYVEGHNEIDGFINVGQESERKLCDRALVFMIRGICSAWRQSIAFYLCEGATPVTTLKSILKDIVKAVADTGLTPKALICDQGGAFQRCVREIQQETRIQLFQNAQTENCLFIHFHMLYLFYNPPQLIKCVRNSMLTNDMVFKGKVTKWTDVIEVYNNDNRHGELRVIPELTDEHVIPSKVNKIKVENCTQVLTEKMAVLMNYTSKYATYVGGTRVSPTLKDTSEAVRFLARLFDSVDGTRGKAARATMQGPVKEVNGTSEHISFWKDAIRILKEIHFVDSSSHPNKHIKTIENWITTLESCIKLWADLKRIGVKCFHTRNLNRDPLDYFIGRIKALNHKNSRPDPYSFTCSFKSLMISDDTGETLLHSESLLGMPFNNSERSDVQNAANTNTAQPGPRAAKTAPSLLQQTRKQRINVHSTAFTAAYVSRKLLKNTKCQRCKNTILTSQPGDIQSWISSREWSLLKDHNSKYPAFRFVILFRHLLNVINKNLDAHCHKQGVTETIRTGFLQTADVSWLGCSLHHRDVVESFINFVCRVRIHNWCRTINQILKGLFSEKLSRHDLPLMLAVQKYQSTRVKRKVSRIRL